MKNRYLLGACALALAIATAAAAADQRTPVYWQHPDGKADFSPAPMKTPDGRDYLPVYDDEAGQAPPAAPAPAAPATSAGKDRGRILYYRNPMGLGDTSPVPKKDPMGMAYVPVYENDAADASAGIVTVAPGRLQVLGVRTAPVESRPAPMRAVRASGTLGFNERTLAVAVSRTEGWVEKLDVASVDEAVKKGQALAEIYSPELAATEREYAVAAQVGGGLSGAVLTRLQALGAPEDEIARLRRTGRPARTITVRAPADGVVVEKMVTAGMKVAPDQPLYRLADTSVLWLVAQVQERDLAMVAPGSKVQASMTAWPDRKFDGTIELIAPSLSPETRTAGVRIVLPNPGGELRAGMYSAVEFTGASSMVMPPALVVPDSAVLDDGVRQVVLVERGEGKFEPRTVHVGSRGDGEAQILDGLASGEKIVVGANFLIDSESNLRAALKGFTAGASAKSGSAKP